ncbi:MAG: hypothetical protein ACKO96_03055 [Flammeovirgaceae bacterium]
MKNALPPGYYRKMKKYIRRAKNYANKLHSKNRGQIFKGRIFKKFSCKGAKRIRKRIWLKAESKFQNTDSYNWGNFLTYAFKASKRMVNNKIKGQTSRHWNILNGLIK